MRVDAGECIPDGEPLQEHKALRVVALVGQQEGAGDSDAERVHEYHEVVPQQKAVHGRQRRIQKVRQECKVTKVPCRILPDNLANHGVRGQVLGDRRHSRQRLLGSRREFG